MAALAGEPPSLDLSPKKSPDQTPCEGFSDTDGSDTIKKAKMVETLSVDTTKEGESAAETDCRQDCQDARDVIKMETDRSNTPTIVITNNNSIDLIDEEKCLVPGVMIRAATLKRLAMAAVEGYDVVGKVLNDSEYPRVLFLMHEWFVKSVDLAQQLFDMSQIYAGSLNQYYTCRCPVDSHRQGISSYESASDHVTCTVPDCEHEIGCSECHIQHYRIKVCHVLRYWIQDFPVHFDLDPKLSQNLQHFQKMILQEGDTVNARLIDISKVPSYDWMRNMSVRSPGSRQSPTSKTSLVVSSLPPQKLAVQLTYLEYRAFRRMTFDDFKNYAIHGSIRNNPKLERSIALFNGLSQWIQCMVLCKTTPQQRADVIVKFVEVAKRLRLMQNFNTLMAVVGGLTHSSLARLMRTNGCIPQDTQKTLAEYTELLSSSNNFSNYRKALHASEGFKIPILGVHLKDLVLLHTALSDRLEGDLINFRKMTQLSITFTELMKVQDLQLSMEPNMDLVSMIKLSLDLHYTEDEIYELSLAREPRNSTSSPSSPTKPVMFAEWVAGVRPPDTVTINKHVHDMVEAVFKNYDHDKDGFISHNEFEDIAGNFPFIDSFCVLDADQDGMISKAEMETYFIRANCHALRNSFKHDFHEQTYFRPTFCIHCTGLLWGIIKQGWKCRECGIHAHKHCKDLVVMECRPKSHALLHGRSSSLSNGEKEKLLKSLSEPSSSSKPKQNQTSTAGISHADSKLMNATSIILRYSETCLERPHVKAVPLDRWSLFTGHRDVTLASKRKMSQRQRRWHSTRATQTEECGINNYPARVNLREEEESVTSSPGRSLKGPLFAALAGRSNSLHNTPSLSAPGSRSNSLQQTEKPPAPASAPGSRSNSLFKAPSQDMPTTVAGSRSNSLFKAPSQDMPSSSPGSRSNSLFKAPSQDTPSSTPGSRSNSLFKMSSQDLPLSAPGSRSNSLFKTPSQDMPGVPAGSVFKAPSQDMPATIEELQPNSLLCKDLSHDAPVSAPGSRSNSLFSVPSQDLPHSAPGSRSNSLFKAPSLDLPACTVPLRSNSLVPAVTAEASSLEEEDTAEISAEEQAGLWDQLQKSQEECERLRLEKMELEARLECQSEQIVVLRTHIGLIRQHTVTFILNQMDTLHMQRDTEV